MLVRMRLPAGDSELVQIMDAALAKAAAKAGARLACREGCTPCCHGAFAINALDGARLKNYMEALRVSDPTLAETIVYRAQQWIEEHGEAYPGNRQTGRLGESDADQEAFEAFANEAACPALDPLTGRCDVYTARPMTCRVFGPPVRMGEGDALGCCELCFIGVPEQEIAACEMDVPHELEAKLLADGVDEGETVVAFALLCATE